MAVDCVERQCRNSASSAVMLHTSPMFIGSYKDSKEALHCNRRGGIGRSAAEVMLQAPPHPRKLLQREAVAGCEETKTASRPPGPQINAPAWVFCMSWCADL